MRQLSCWGGRIGSVIISRENPYRSPQAEGRPTRWHFNFKLILYSAFIGGAVNLVSEIRLVSLFGLNTYLEWVLRDDMPRAWSLVVDLAWSAGTGAAIGAIASLVLALSKRSQIQTDPRRSLQS